MKIIDLYKALMHYSAQQSTGFRILCIVLFGSIVFRVFLPFIYSGSDELVLDSLIEITVCSEYSVDKINWSDSVHRFQPFNPNTASARALSDLGFSKKYVNNLHKYLSKGGHFYKGTDLYKIYDADTLLIDMLIPFVELDQQQISRIKVKKVPLHDLFHVNMNSISRDSLLLLGFSDRYVNNLIKYRKNGGVFYDFRGMLKIYQADTLLIMRLEPYMVFSQRSTTNLAAKGHAQKSNVAFKFDPNTISVDSLILLGFTPKQANTLNNYRMKGARFTLSSDLYRLYGIDSQFVQTLIPYVSIRKARSVHTVSIKVDINTADSLELLAISGVGPVFANRIISRREKLGGFYSVQQLDEVYGLSEEVVKKIQPYTHIVDSTRQMININFCSKQELAIHPYITWKEAQAFVNYRSSHGMFSDLQAISKSGIFEEYEKLVHYLTCDQ